MTATPTTDTEPPRFSRNLSKLDYVVLAAIGVGIVLIVYSLMIGVTGDDRVNIPDNIESVNPVVDAVQVPSQASITVDLADGFTGALVIDGIEIETVSIEDYRSIGAQPGTQVDLPPVTIYEPGNDTLSFTPSSGAAVTEFDQGQHTVELRYWEVGSETRQIRTFTWSFNVI